MTPQHTFTLAIRPDVLLRTEALVGLAVVSLLYQDLFPGTWVFFAVLFFVPDVSLLGYALKSKRFAAGAYNLIHSYALPLALAILSWEHKWTRSEQISLIWLAHISFDRALGYGLKYPRIFQADSHPARRETELIRARVPHKAHVGNNPGDIGMAPLRVYRTRAMSEPFKATMDP